jgi:putative ABC transport system permease protein
MPAVWISEPMQEIYRLAPGQPCACRCSDAKSRSSSAASGATTRQFGAVVISRRRLPARSAAISSPPTSRSGRYPAQEAQASAWLATAGRAPRLEVADSATIRRLSLSIFDKSFAVTYALEAAAMLIGLFGLAVTLAASVWLRARELATLARWASTAPC